MIIYIHLMNVVVVAKRYGSLAMLSKLHLYIMLLNSLRLVHIAYYPTAYILYKTYIFNLFVTRKFHTGELIYRSKGMRMPNIPNINHRKIYGQCGLYF